MVLCVLTIESRWGNDCQKRLEFLMHYGANANEVVPLLRERRSPNEPERLRNIDKAIAAIEAAADSPKLIRLEDFVSYALSGNPEE